MGISAANAQLMIIGVLVSGIVGYITIKYFLRFLAGQPPGRFRVLSLGAGGGDVRLVVARAETATTMPTLRRRRPRLTDD